MSATPKQRAYHDRRALETVSKLNAALERMQSGKPIRLLPGFKWTKKNWAFEAEVHKSTPTETLLDGTFQFARENARFEQLKAGKMPRCGRVQRLMQEITSLRDENRRLKDALAGRVAGTNRAA